jgi:Tfp pilus assembly protein PilF
MGDYETASKNLEQLASRYPQKAEVLNLNGILAVLQGNHSKGLAYFKRCFRLKSRLPAVLVNAGAAYSLRDNFQKAERFFKTYLGQQPNDKIALLWLVQNSIKNGDLPQADIYMNRLIRMVPVQDLVAWLRGDVSQNLYKDTMIAPEIDPQIRVRLSKILNHTSGREIRYIQKNS